MGSALESRLKPLFVGATGSATTEDRLRRDDVRYVLTYDLPRIGYESQTDWSHPGILDSYPRRRIVAVFEVDETPGADRAVLIRKCRADPLLNDHRTRDVNVP